ncbi:MAG: hypothetical protein IJ443_03435, partial [Firmicutes bacterium]|nr:hypothetical protein [Bacillota bacterium]
MAKRIKKEKLSEKTIVEIYADYLTAQAARDLSKSTIPSVDKRTHGLTVPAQAHNAVLHTNHRTSSTPICVRLAS